MSVILFLSPHLDDAVFSCAGRILSELQEGNRVIVATVFSHCGGDEENTALYEQRREEDCRAGKLLGAEMIWLGLSDAPFRNAYYNSFRRIVFGRHHQERQNVVEVAHVIRGLSSKFNPVRVYCPLAIGTHIDHRLVHEAARKSLPGGKILFYEDRPYAFVKHAVRLRLCEMGADMRAGDRVNGLRAESGTTIWEEFAKSFLVAPYVQHYLPAGRETEVCLEKLQRGFARRQRVKFCPEPENEICNASKFQQVVRAVDAYETQVGAFLGGRSGFRAMAREYAAWLKIRATHVERYWRVGGVG